MQLYIFLKEVNMKFYGTGLIWDKDKNNVMCEFKKTGLREGELETQDNILIKKLKELGYKEEAKKSKK
jgi:hypothetical protein